MNFTGIQARAVALGFSAYFHRAALPVFACAILPDHVHLVVARPAITVEKLVIQLKGEATRQLEREGLHPLASWKVDGNQVPKCWVRGQWKVFLNMDDVPRAITYVEQNPLKEGKKKQQWSFVKKFN